MTTETPTRREAEIPDEPNVWRILGRLEANQHTMLQRMDRQDDRMDKLEAKMDKMFYGLIAVGGGVIVTLISVIATN